MAHETSVGRTVDGRTTLRRARRGVFGFEDEILVAKKAVFDEVSGRYNGPDLEKKVLEFWREHDVFAKTLEATRNGPQFSFNEGPPTANGKPGIHHVLARSFKDVFPRYKTMRGYHVPRKAGWDTHGLPVEHEVEKELGIFDKQAALPNLPGAVGIQ